MNIIEIKEVSKTFKTVTAVNRLSLKVPRGSIYGFIGPNGSGKTTTIRMIMNILYPDSGNISVFGHTNGGKRHDEIGYLPEERGLYKKMKVADLLHFHGQLKNGKDLKKQVDYWLKRLELSDRAGSKVETLSKGMTQKLHLIATLIPRPSILILDEPFSGLDPVNADTLRSVILEMREQGTTVIFSTHDMNMAERMCDYIFMIHRGEKVLDGTLAEIQDRYGNDTIRIRTEAGMDALRDLAGIEKVNDFGQQQEIRISRESDPQDILSRIMARTRVNRFEVTRPSLHDIFVRIVKPENNSDHA